MKVHGGRLATVFISFCLPFDGAKPQFTRMGQFAFCALLSCGAFDFFFFDLDNAWTGPQHIPDADLYAVGTPAFRIRKSPMSFAESWESGCSIDYTNFQLLIENNPFIGLRCVKSNSYALV